MSRRRFLFLLIASLCLYLLVLIRLFYLQVWKGKYYKELSERNYVRKRILYPQRGDILDRRGERLAHDEPRYFLLLDPQKLEDKQAMDELAKNIKSLFGIDLDYERLRKISSVEPIVLTELKTQEDIDRFYNYSFMLPGVYINTVPVRVYPYGQVCAHVVGYTGYPSKKELEKYKERIGPQSLVGMYGLERAFDDKLLGRVGAEEVMVNASGRIVKSIGTIEPEKGHTIVSTIDIRIQRIAYEVFESSGHKAGAVIVMDARSGETLALLSYPSFDPNLISDKWQEYTKDPLKPMFNRALFGKYPPASVVKPALGIAILQKGVSPKEGVVCKGKLTIGNRNFYCWNRGGHGWENLRGAIRDSCDVYFYHMGFYVLGFKEIERTLRNFGYGEDVPFDLPHAKGFIPTPEWKKRRFKEPWYGGDTVNLSIGQGYILSTLLEQTLMMMGIANNGVIYRPRLVKEIRDMDGRSVWKAKREVYKVVKAPQEYFAIVREALRDVVRSGTGASANSSIVEIAGKTGTAQISFHSVRRKNLPYHLRDHAWFVGFAPYRDPIFVIGVLVEHGGSGGSSAAPIARRILERIYIEGIHKELS